LPKDTPSPLLEPSYISPSAATARRGRYAGRRGSRSRPERGRAGRPRMVLKPLWSMGATVSVACVV
jgi:hypothetical protein